jgi:amino acid transporter
VCVFSVLFTIYTPVYTTIAAVCAMFLYLSYVLPVAAGLVVYRRKWTKMGPFSLGGAYRLVAALCVAGCAVLFYIGVQPPNDQALKVLLGTAIVTAALWFGLERRRFAGPPVGEAIASRREVIESREQEIGA